MKIKSAFLIISTFGCLLLFNCEVALGEVANFSVPLTMDEWFPLASHGESDTIEEVSLDGVSFGIDAYRTGVQAFTITTFDLRGATVYIRWKIHGPTGRYCACGVGIGWPYVNSLSRPGVYFAASAGYTTPSSGEWFSTHNSWSGSRVVQDDTWYFTRIEISGSRQVYVATALDNFDDMGGTLFSSHSFEMSQENWSKLSEASIAANFVDNYGGSDTRITVGGVSILWKGHQEPSTPKLEVSTVSLDFGTVSVGRSKTIEITIENTGTAALNIRALSINGTSANSYSFDSNCTTIEPGEVCNVDISLAPVTVGSNEAYLFIDSNDPQSSLHGIPLKGIAIPNAEATSTAEMALPNGIQVFTYPIVSTPYWETIPGIARPISIGSCSPENEGLDMGVLLGKFKGPVDVYVAVYVPDIDPKTTYILWPDGSFHPDTQGLFPWKSNLNSSFDETFLSGIDTNVLPEGAYHIFVGVSPSGKQDSFYVWHGILQVPGPCAPGQVKEGSVGFVRGEVVAPGATLIYRGREFDRPVQVSDNTLIGLKKDGKVYLYHPAMGHVKLDDETSAKAVGYFVANMAVGSSEVLKSTPIINRSKRLLRSNAEDLPDWIVTLDTGIVIETRGHELLAKNNYKRWVALRIPNNETTLLSSKYYFLGPRDSYLPDDILDALWRWAGDSPIVGSSPSERSLNFESPLYMQTFGAIFSVFPTPILVQMYGNSTWRQSYINAIKSDPVLFAQVNTLECIDFLIEGVQQLLGVLIPETCLGSLTSDVGVGLMKPFLMSLVTPNDMGSLDLEENSISRTAFQDWLSDAAQALVKCVATAVSFEGTPLATAALEVASKFNDIYSGGKWIAEDLVLQSIITQSCTIPYDEFSLNATVEKLEIKGCRASGDLYVHEDGQITYTCNATGAISVDVDFSGSHYEAGGRKLSYDPSTGLWSGTFPESPSLEGIRPITFTAYGAQGESVTCETNILVKGTLNIKYCSLSAPSGDLEAGKQQEIVISCSVEGRLPDHVTADLSALGGDEGFDLRLQDDGMWLGETTVNPDAPGKFNIVVTAGDSGQTSTYTLKVDVLDMEGDNSISFNDPSGKWTITLDLGHTSIMKYKGRAEVVTDKDSYTGQWVNVLLDRLPANPHAWEEFVPAVVSIWPSYEVKTWTLYYNNGNSDPTFRKFKSYMTSDELKFSGQFYYWLEIVPTSGPGAIVIFKFTGTE